MKDIPPKDLVISAIALILLPALPSLFCNLIAVFSAQAQRFQDWVLLLTWAGLVAICIVLWVANLNWLVKNPRMPLPVEEPVEATASLLPIKKSANVAVVVLALPMILLLIAVFGCTIFVLLGSAYASDIALISTVAILIGWLGLNWKMRKEYLTLPSQPATDKPSA